MTQFCQNLHILGVEGYRSCLIYKLSQLTSTTALGKSGFVLLHLSLVSYLCTITVILPYLKCTGGCGKRYKIFRMSPSLAVSLFLDFLFLVQLLV